MTRRRCQQQEGGGSFGHRRLRVCKVSVLPLTLPVNDGRSARSLGLGGTSNSATCACLSALPMIHF